MILNTDSWLPNLLEPLYLFLCVHFYVKMYTHSEKYRLKKIDVDTFVCPGRMKAAPAELGAQTLGLRCSVLPRCAV